LDVGEGPIRNNIHGLLGTRNGIFLGVQIAFNGLVERIGLKDISATLLPVIHINRVLNGVHSYNIYLVGCFPIHLPLEPGIEEPLELIPKARLYNIFLVNCATECRKDSFTVCDLR